MQHVCVYVCVCGAVCDCLSLGPASRPAVCCVCRLPCKTLQQWSRAAGAKCRQKVLNWNHEARDLRPSWGPKRFASPCFDLAWLGLGIVCVLWPARKRRIDTRTAAATAAADCAQIRQANKPVAVAQGCRQFGCLVGSPFAHMQHTRAAAAAVAEAAATIAF